MAVIEQHLAPAGKKGKKIVRLFRSVFDFKTGRREIRDQADFNPADTAAIAAYKEQLMKQEVCGFRILQPVTSGRAGGCGRTRRRRE